MVVVSGTLATAGAQLWGFGDWTVWAIAVAVNWLFWYHARVSLERKRTRNALVLGRMIVHNSDKDGIPSNAAWDNAVFRMHRDEHAEGPLKEAKHIAEMDTISLEWEQS